MSPWEKKHVVTDPSIPDYVQRKIARTNGHHYRQLVNKLNVIPIPDFSYIGKNQSLMLDIGCGWGRWMAAAAHRGIVPVGLDIQLDAVRAALEIHRQFGLRAYGVVGDFSRLPFSSDLFNLVWSFSALQHAHKDLVRLCVSEIGRILVNKGDVMLQFPNRNGLSNRLRRHTSDTEHDVRSWAVRYYSEEELHHLMSEFDNVAVSVHSFFGLGVCPSDAKYLPMPMSLVIRVCSGITEIAQVLPRLGKFADSFFITGTNSNSKTEAEASPERI